MGLHNITRIDTSAGVTSHAHPLMSPGIERITRPAHPSPLNEKITDKESDHLRDLVSKVKLDFMLRGLSSDDGPSACSLIVPRVRRSPLTNGAIQHLDIVSCWKGLSPSQGLELAAWEGIFNECLALQIKQHVLGGFVDWLGTYRDPTNEVLLISRLDEILRFERTFDLNVSIADLVEKMISHLYEEHRSETLYCNFPWSLSSRHLPNLVYNVVRTRDCFLYTGAEAHVLFDVSHSYNGGILTVLANIHWQMPRIAFNDLPTELSYGEMYRIIPQIDETSLGTTMDSGCNAYEDAVSYSVARSAVPLQWDCDGGFFHARILCKYKYLRGRGMETIFCTEITTQFHSGVRFERLSRHSVKLNLNNDKNPNFGPYDNNVVSDMFEQNDDIRWFDPRLLDLAESSTSTLTQSICNPGSPWVPSYTSTPLSKTGSCVSRVIQSKGIAPWLDDWSADSYKAIMDYHVGRNSCDIRRGSVVSQYSDSHDVMHDLEIRQNCNPYNSRRDSVISQATDSCSPRSESPTTVRCGVALRASEKDFSTWRSPIGTQHTFPSKRKASCSSDAAKDSFGRCALDKFEHLDLEVDAKRRKLGQFDDLYVHMDTDGAADVSQYLDGTDDVLDIHLTNITTGPMGEAQTSPAYNEVVCWFEKLDETKFHVAPRPRTAALAGIKHTKFPWNCRTEQYIAHLPLDASSGSVHEITPPVSATSTHPPASVGTVAISQEQIQYNYHEFEDCFKKKAAEKAYYAATIPGFDGVVSPTDENDKTFERIFLDDSEGGDWESDVDAMSECIGSVCLDAC